MIWIYPSQQYNVMEGDRLPPPTLAHQYIVRQHHHHSPIYVTTENNFVPLSPEFRVKPFDVIIADNGMTLRELCLKRLRDQSMRQRKVISDNKTPLRSPLPEEVASQELSRIQIPDKKEDAVFSFQDSKRPTLKLSTINPGEGELQNPKENKKLRILKETVRRYHAGATAAASKQDINNAQVEPIIKMKQVEALGFPDQSGSTRQRNNTLTQKSKINQSSLILTQRRESAHAVNSPINGSELSETQSYQYIHQAQQNNHYSSVLRGEATLLHEKQMRQPFSQLLSPKAESYFSITERKHESINQSMLAEGLIPGGIPKKVLLPSINIKRLLEKLDETKKTQRQRNHTVVTAGFMSISSKQTNRSEIMALEKTITDGKSQFSVSHLKEQIMTTMQLAHQQDKSKQRKQLFSLIQGNVLPVSPTNRSLQLQKSMAPSPRMVPPLHSSQSPQLPINRHFDPLNINLLPKNAAELRRASMNYGNAFPQSQFRLNRIKSKKQVNSDEEAPAFDLDSLSSSKSHSHSQSEEETHIKKRERRGTHILGEPNLPLIVKKFGKFRTDMNVANQKDAIINKKRNSTLQKQNEISPDMKTTQISAFKLDDLGNGKQLDQILERFYDSDSSGYSCTISSMMDGPSRDKNGDYYEINNDYTILRQQKGKYIQDIDKPLKVTTEEVKQVTRLPRVRVQLSGSISPRRQSLGREDIARQREHIRKIIEEEVLQKNTK